MERSLGGLQNWSVYGRTWKIGTRARMLESSLPVRSHIVSFFGSAEGVSFCSDFDNLFQECEYQLFEFSR